MKTRLFSARVRSCIGPLNGLPAWLLCVILVAVAHLGANAAPDSSGNQSAGKDTQADESSSKKKTELPIPKEESSVTHHSVKIGGEDIGYTATAGNLLIHKGDDPVASMFYVAYTQEGVKSLEQRPVTFFYNGGPGSATIWLHMGSYGPRIVETANAQATGPALLHCQGEARRQGCNAVHLDTGYQRHLAHLAYLRNGFRLDCHHLAWEIK